MVNVIFNDKTGKIRLVLFNSQIDQFNISIGKGIYYFKIIIKKFLIYHLTCYIAYMISNFKVEMSAKNEICFDIKIKNNTIIEEIRPDKQIPKWTYDLTRIESLGNINKLNIISMSLF